MAAPRRVVNLTISRKELSQLRSIARSRTEAAARVGRARMLLAYREDPSFFAVGHALGVHHQTEGRILGRFPGDELQEARLAVFDQRPVAT